MLKNKTIRREYKGSQPYSFGILERRPGQNLKTNTTAQVYEKEKNFDNWKTQWESKLFDVKVENLTRLRFNAVKAEQKKLLEEKKDSLQKMLKNERFDYIQETNDLMETREDRVNRLRKQVEDVRSKREKEHKNIVQQKQDEQFKNNADPLRSLRHHYAELELKRSRDHQVATAAEIEEENKKEAEFWNDYIHQNTMLKEEVEMAKEAERLAKNIETREFLRQQIKEREDERKELKKCDTKLINDLINDSKLEELEKMNLKKQKQNEMKFLLDQSLCLKNQRISDEKKEEQDFDKLLLEENKLSLDQDLEWISQRKSELRKEALQYLNYLRENAIVEKQREEEILKYVRNKDNEINELSRQKRLVEKSKKQQLADSIKDFQQSYRCNKEHENELIKEDKLKARTKLLEDLAELEKERQCQTQKERNSKLERRREILAQIAHCNLLREEERNQKYLEKLAMDKAEEEYKDKMQRFINEENEKNYKLFLK